LILGAAGHNVRNVGVEYAHHVLCGRDQPLPAEAAAEFADAFFPPEFRDSLTARFTPFGNPIRPGEEVGYARLAEISRGIRGDYSLMIGPALDAPSDDEPTLPPDLFEPGSWPAGVDHTMYDLWALDICSSAIPLLPTDGSTVRRVTAADGRKPALVEDCTTELCLGGMLPGPYTVRYHDAMSGDLLTRRMYASCFILSWDFYKMVPQVDHVQLTPHHRSILSGRFPRYEEFRSWN
jgi:hypothetical protein